MEKSQTAINTSSDFKTAQDLKPRIDDILSDIAQKTGFVVKKIIWSSDYYGTGKVGAVNYRGQYKSKSAVLKIQGAKPEVSEVDMIRLFQSQNKSKIIRAPIIYWHQGWDKEKGYEAFIMEDIVGKKVIEDGAIAKSSQITRFFEIYLEYKSNCLNTPWLSQPKNYQTSLSDVGVAWDMGNKVKPNNPFRQETDLELAKKACNILLSLKEKTDLQFQHGHLSVNDLINQGKEVIIFSNLFWKWKHPFYDAVFGYHWHIYSLNKIEGITPTQIETQRSLWIREIYQLSNIKNDKRIVAALLERALAGLLLDSFAYIDDRNPIAEYMVTSTRQQVIQLVDELS